MKKFWILLATVAALTACSKGKVENPLDLIPVADRQAAPEVSVDWVTTQDAPNLAKLKGHVVMVTFWATWCGPCRMELPNIVKIYNARKAQGFQVLGLSVDQPDLRKPGSAGEFREYIRKFLSSYDVTYPVGFAGAPTQQAYQINAIPASFLIDKEGRLAQKLVGLYPEDQIADAVDRLLKE